MDQRTNEKRGLFVIDGMLGFLIATVVLVLVTLTFSYLSMAVQDENQQKYYKIVNEESIEMRNTQSRTNHIVNVKIDENGKVVEVKEEEL
ncbi:DUF4006 family protein [Sulfurimonas sp.]|jgi:hypothetical protein|uniref:DUF4006 family protein n=1 Tax=Sulfurimonas sp. TaxID=2022749 RepID=UPI0025DA40E2|nr:DUF4006 family protein [Sulfurimonas sp.]MBT5935288.1 DUF4006 family protein [Sulfurimonas sp.]